MDIHLSLKKATRNFLYLFYPPHCYICENPLRREQSEVRYLCKSCKSKIGRVEGPFCICGSSLKSEDTLVDLCSECASQKRYFDRARSYGYYEKSLKKLIKAFKNQGEKELSRELSFFLKEVIEYLPYKFSVITFIPITSIRLRKRGFNQTKLLAYDLADWLDADVVTALEKVRENQPQKGLSRKEREENVKGVFRCIVEGSGDILLVDDVYTSGATVNEASRVLKEGGYKRVLVVSVARAG